jgi:predicted enzyme related to lactoylglutathione lyase
MANPVGWFEIYVQDLPRAKAFYESVFQKTLEHLDTGDEIEMWAFPMEPEGQGAAGALCRMDGAPSGGMGTIVYFMCEDCAVEAKRLAEHGGRIHKDKFSIGEYGFIALGLDTEGNMIGLHSLK